MWHDERRVRREGLELSQTPDWPQLIFGEGEDGNPRYVLLTGMRRKVGEGLIGISRNVLVAISRRVGLDSVMSLGNRDAKYAPVSVVPVKSLSLVRLTQVYSFFTSILPNLSNRSRNQFRLCVSPISHSVDWDGAGIVPFRQLQLGLLGQTIHLLLVPCSYATQPLIALPQRLSGGVETHVDLERSGSILDTVHSLHVVLPA